MNYSEIRSAARLASPASFSSKLEIFAHHFPRNPLLPGALSGLLLAENCGGTDWSLKKIKGLRFRKPLTPDLPVVFTSFVAQESANEKVCSGKILSGNDTIADGDFTFTKVALPLIRESRLKSDAGFWTATQIREYLPHGETIVLIDELVEVHYPPEIQDALSGQKELNLDQAQLIGTRIHTKSDLEANNFWLDQNILPSTILSELVAQAGALILAPFFKGTKPQVSLLGCDTEYFGLAAVGATIDTFVELTRVKRLGKLGNMILFSGECYVGQVKIAQISFNAMASF
ncbi:MAG: hypothetical protein IPM97_11050 [Bdellovibrionaceae bacterium]|nr:hypothetical protein [Pseudobdellovibrionaceae bacterium]